MIENSTHVEQWYPNNRPGIVHLPLIIVLLVECHLPSDESLHDVPLAISAKFDDFAQIEQKAKPSVHYLFSISEP